MAERFNTLKFPLQSHSLVFRIYNVNNYGIDDLVMQQSRNSMTARIMQTEENLVPNRKVRDILVNPSKT